MAVILDNLKMENELQALALKVNVKVLHRRTVFSLACIRAREENPALRLR
jgi:5-carboxymethyl-2-hydroxymuconate isomerase